MDPISHVVIGRALTAAFDGDRRLGRGAGGAAILGALAPDVDGVLVPWGWDVYLRAHEIGTHSLAGGLLVACAAAAAVRLVTRGSRFAALAAAAAAAAMSHIALDVLSGARIRIAWPFADARVTVPVMAMADPWFVAICIAGACAAMLARPRFGGIARATLVAAAVLLCAKGTLLVRTMRLSPRPLESLSVLDARWGSFTEWYAYERGPETVRSWSVNSHGGPATLITSEALAPESALVHRSRQLDTVRNFLRTHDFAFPIEQPADRTTTVLWSDVRYCQRPREPIDCALWFGGVFGPDGQAVTQEVRVGSWVQTRPAPR